MNTMTNARGTSSSPIFPENSVNNTVAVFVVAVVVVVVVVVVIDDEVSIKLDSYSPFLTSFSYIPHLYSLLLGHEA